ncbi:LysM peptidoglycan-binding domain-containing protein [Nocardioides albidus]|uniref:LysM peptidoglycan-binding domain-containing protein n=1 Tax=Nocardioides albidus TaxID=1517589 RepID=A0A5C4VQK9_9ACTN|nr:LysM domain-containing protein [Nocardioides albidus]TNM37539.1 LysM peptidoglycan-binding domain-containing protein [Nocardioides albidus]
MELVVAGGARLRASLLWLSVTLALGALAASVGPLVGALARMPGPTFADALVQLCAAISLVAGGGLWLAATDVAWAVLRSPRSLPPRAVGPLRRLLLAACGITILATTAPAGAAPSTVGRSGTDSGADAGAAVDAGAAADTGARLLEGLPLPDRATGRPSPPRRGALVTVRPGDSLWTIAAARLGPDAAPADVASYWLRVQDLNAAALGTDPDLIQPGQTLRLPPA